MITSSTSIARNSRALASRLRKPLHQYNYDQALHVTLGPGYRKSVRTGYHSFTAKNSSGSVCADLPRGRDCMRKTCTLSLGAPSSKNGSDDLATQSAPLYSRAHSSASLCARPDVREGQTAIAAVSTYRHVYICRSVCLKCLAAKS